MPTPNGSTGSVVDQIRGLLPELPGAQRTLAELIVNDPARIAHMTIVELSELCGVSTGTVTRLCRLLGLSGYSALRIALAADAPRTTRGTWDGEIGIDITEDDDIDRVARGIANNLQHVVEQALQHLDLAAVARAADLISAAGRIVVGGVGGSGTVASELQQRLYRIGIPVWMWSDTHVAMTGTALLAKDDVLVVFSHSGQTQEMCDLLAEARRREAATVAITNSARSAVGYRADLVLATEVPQLGFHTEAILARHAQLAVVDLLYVIVAQRSISQTRRAMAVTAEAVTSRRSASGRDS
jgi:DNA-binding MurR/RpiR family transcriptional regulator